VLQKAPEPFIGKGSHLQFDKRRVLTAEKNATIGTRNPSVNSQVEIPVHPDLDGKASWNNRLVFSQEEAKALAETRLMAATMNSTKNNKTLTANREGIIERENRRMAELREKKRHERIRLQVKAENEGRYGPEGTDEQQGEDEGPPLTSGEMAELELIAQLKVDMEKMMSKTRPPRNQAVLYSHSGSFVPMPSRFTLSGEAREAQLQRGSGESPEIPNATPGDTRAAAARDDDSDSDQEIESAWSCCLATSYHARGCQVRKMDLDRWHLESQAG